MKMTLVRHTSVDVPKGVCYGQSDVGLRATFAEEAERVRENLKEGSLMLFTLLPYRGA